MTDLTRLRDFAEKKTISVSAARLLHSDVAGTTLQELFNLPEKCLIVDAGIVVDVAGQGGLTVDFGFAGGNELGNDIALDSTGYKQVSLVTALTTGTGKNVTAKFSADPSAGDFTFIVEYIEYTLKNGQRTDYTAH